MHTDYTCLINTLTTEKESQHAELLIRLRAQAIHQDHGQEQPDESRVLTAESSRNSQTNSHDLLLSLNQQLNAGTDKVMLGGKDYRNSFTAKTGSATQSALKNRTFQNFTNNPDIHRLNELGAVIRT